MSSSMVSLQNRNAKLSESDSDSIKDEIGDEEISDRNDLIISDENWKGEDDVVPNKLDLVKMSSQVCKSARLGDSENGSSNFLHLQTNNFQRRASIFDSLIGDFGATHISNVGKPKNWTFLGDSSSKFDPIIIQNCN
jgi:gentisate 1,2-dioxygenase